MQTVLINFEFQINEFLKLICDIQDVHVLNTVFLVTLKFGYFYACSKWFLDILILNILATYLKLKLKSYEKKIFGNKNQTPTDIYWFGLLDEISRKVEDWNFQNLL